MNKIEELKLTLPKFYQQYNGHAIDRIMKEYAEWYARQVISKIKQPENKIYNAETGHRFYGIDDNFKLPDHD